MKSGFFYGMLVVLLASCGESKTEEKSSATAPETRAAVSDSVEKKKPFEGVVFASQKDPVCGMPLRAGVEDTAHYKDGVYGFCAAECKEEFVKNPDQYLKGEKKKEMK